MSMAIKGLYSSDWLYTQTPLPWIRFLQPWHCWHHFPSPLHLRWKEAKTNTKEARKNAVRQRRNTKGGKKRGTSDIFILLECSCLAPLVAIWKGLVRRHKHQTIKKEKKRKAIFHDGTTRCSVKVITKAVFFSKHKLTKLFKLHFYLFLPSVSISCVSLLDLR